MTHYQKSVASERSRKSHDRKMTQATLKSVDSPMMLARHDSRRAPSSGTSSGNPVMTFNLELDGGVAKVGCVSSCSRWFF